MDCSDLFWFDDKYNRHRADWQKWVVWIAQDADGRWCGYLSRPTMNTKVDEWSPDHSRHDRQWCYLWHTPPHPKGWEHTLMNLAEFEDA